MAPQMNLFYILYFYDYMMTSYKFCALWHLFVTYILFIERLCLHIYISILCKCQDVLMLLKFPRFSRVMFLPLTILCFLSLVVGAENFYHGNVTFNIKLILRVILYPHNSMCFLKCFI